jgi:hypothetical protein
MRAGWAIGLNAAVAIVTGTVSMTEIIAAGGKGVLSFQGRSYPFKLVGGVTGGGGASDTQANGEVYNLGSTSIHHAPVSRSASRPTATTRDSQPQVHSTASARMARLPSWTYNPHSPKRTIVVLTLSLGREEVLIEML